MKKIKVIVEITKEKYENKLVEFMNDGFEIKFANLATFSLEPVGLRFFAILEKEE